MTISEFIISKIGCGYVYGATGWICTPERRAEQAKQYPAQADNILNVSKKWDGKQCYDCAQLTKAAATAAGYVTADNKPLVPSGATSQWTADIWEVKRQLPLGDGTWAKENLDADTFVFRQDKSNPKKMAHVGIYIGNGYVVEAKGAAYGVMKTELAKGSWTHFAALKPILIQNVPISAVSVPKTDKATQQEAETATQSAELQNAIITAKTGDTVNLRKEPCGKVLAKMPIGASVYAGDEQQLWIKVRYKGTGGWVLSDYVSKGVG